MNKLLLLTIITTFFACGDGAKENSTNNEGGNNPNETDTTEKIDTVVKVKYEYAPEVKALITELPRRNEEILIIDSNYITSITDKYGQKETGFLTAEEIQLIGGNHVGVEYTLSAEWEIKKAIFLDSLRQNGGFEEYQESLDLGGTRVSNAFLVEMVTLNDSTEVLLWYLSYSTYEACPYASGDYILGTLIHNKSIGQTVILGQDYGAGDPPVSMSANVDSKTDGNTAHIHLYEVHEDEDDTGVYTEETDTTYTFNISGNEFILKE